MTGRLLHAEWTRLRTVRTPAVLAVVLAVLTGAAVVSLLVVARSSGVDVGEPGFARALFPAVGYLVVVPFLLGALAVTADRRHGGHVATHLVVPRPAGVLAAQAAVHALAGALLGVVAALATAVVAGAVLGVLGHGVTGVTGVLAATPAGALAAGVTLALAAAVGTAVGSLARGAVLALGTGLGWLVVVEPLLLALVPGAQRWLPGSAAVTLANLANAASLPGGPREVVVAAAALGGCTLLLVAAALAATRRDQVR